MRTTRRIEFGDTDMAGIVHFANFFRFMESAECEFLRSRGLSVKMVWEGEHIGFPRVSATCDYVKPARFEDVLTIAVTVEKVGKRSVTYRFDFANGETPVATGRVVAVYCRSASGGHIEALDIPDEVRVKLAG